MRTIIELPEAQIKALTALCEREQVSRAALIREAVAEYLSARATSVPDQAFGLWRGRGEDGLSYQERLRSNRCVPSCRDSRSLRSTPT